MEDDRLDIEKRVAVLTEIVRQGGERGRTWLMKMVYLLQTVKGVPLGYDFELYLYGPYSTQVLNDLSVAVFWDALQENYYSSPSGYGYNIRLGSRSDDLKQDPQLACLLEGYRDSINWAVERFKAYSTSEIEAVGTLVWVDREMKGRKRSISLDELLSVAQEIKPHFPRERFQKIAEKFIEEGVLKNVQPFHTV